MPACALGAPHAWKSNAWVQAPHAWESNALPVASARCMRSRAFRVEEHRSTEVRHLRQTCPAQSVGCAFACKLFPSHPPLTVFTRWCKVQDPLRNPRDVFTLGVWIASSWLPVGRAVYDWRCSWEQQQQQVDSKVPKELRAAWREWGTGCIP